MNQKNLYKIIQLKPNEEIVALVHESAIPHLPKFAFGFLLLLVPFFLLFPLFSAGILGVIGFFALLGLALYYFWRAFFKWANTVLVITDRRLIDIDQKALFDRSVCEAPYSQIDEVSHRVRGICPTLFGYGQIKIQMAGQAADIEFVRAKHPARVHDLIQDLRRVIEDHDRDFKEAKLRELAKRTSVEEVEAMEVDWRRREREQGLNELYGEE